MACNAYIVDVAVGKQARATSKYGHHDVPERLARGGILCLEFVLGTRLVFALVNGIHLVQQEDRLRGEFRDVDDERKFQSLVVVRIGLYVQEKAQCKCAAACLQQFSRLTTSLYPVNTSPYDKGGQVTGGCINIHSRDSSPGVACPPAALPDRHR